MKLTDLEILNPTEIYKQFQLLAQLNIDASWTLIQEKTKTISEIELFFKNRQVLPWCKKISDPKTMVAVSFFCLILSSITPLILSGIVYILYGIYIFAVVLNLDFKRQKLEKRAQCIDDCSVHESDRSRWQIVLQTMRKIYANGYERCINGQPINHRNFSRRLAETWGIVDDELNNEIFISDINHVAYDNTNELQLTILKSTDKFDELAHNANEKLASIVNNNNLHIHNKRNFNIILSNSSLEEIKFQFTTLIAVSLIVFTASERVIKSLHAVGADIWLNHFSVSVILVCLFGYVWSFKLLSE